MSVALEPESDDAEAFGLTADDLQSNLAVSGNQITGTLKNITDGSVWDAGTWGEGLSTGNFIFLKAVNVPDDAVATVELYGGVTGPVTLDSDRNIVLRVTNKNTQKVVLKVVKDGVAETKTYGLKGLTLAT